MTDRTSRTLLALILITMWGFLLRPVWSPPDAGAQTGTPAAEALAVQDSVELTKLYEEDQGDRRPAAGKLIDWKVVGPRDAARLARVKEMYAQDLLKTGADYYHAAMVLQHAEVPEDFLLAHELCVAAISKGHEKAKWLAAASEDRFLMNLGRPQRFATQYRADPMPDGPMALYKVDSGVTDSLRAALDVPPLAKAQERLEEINRVFGRTPPKIPEKPAEPTKAQPASPPRR
jgi:hypothetical protein